MTYTAPTDDILYSEGGPIFSLQASGAIYAGQCLTADGTMECKVASNADDAFIGVALYDVSNDDYVAIAGPGNIVRCIVNGTSKCTSGDDMMISGTEGKISNTGLAAGTKIGVALETQATDGGTVRVLLV